MPAIRDEQLIDLLRHMAESSERRSELSAERSYQNAERNLSLLVHAGSALMILGLAVDRYRLFLRHAAPTDWGGNLGVGVSMVALGTLAVLAGGLRYLPFVHSYHRNRRLYPGRSAYLAPVFALLAGVCGTATLIYMWLL